MLEYGLILNISEVNSLPNIKSAVKRVKIIKAKTLKNKMIKSALKTHINSFENFVTDSNSEGAKEAFTTAVKKIDQAVAKGTLHKNTAARKKSQLQRKLKSISA